MSKVDRDYLLLFFFALRLVNKTRATNSTNQM